jgi:HK97 family phage major capsid protein
MRFKTVKQVETDLNAIAKQHGATGFDAAKAAYLKTVTVTDDEGSPLDPDNISFDVKIEKAAEIQADAIDLDATIAKSVEKALADAIAKRGFVETKAARITADATKFVPRMKPKNFKDAKTAHDFGRWIQASTWGAKAPQALDYCRKEGIPLQWATMDADGAITIKATGHHEANNVDGGFLVPPQFDNELVWLREQFGVFRRNAGRKIMSSDSLSFSRKTSSHTAVWNGEGTTNSTTKMQFDQIQLFAKKLRVDGYLTKELSEDAAIALGDEAARDISEAFALAEDRAGFIGDGTSSFGGIVGLQNAFLNLGSIANSAGISDAAAADWNSVTIAQLMAWFSLLPVYAETNAKIYCHSRFYYQILERLQATGGGNAMVDLATGQSIRQFLGHPVEFTQVLPSAAVADVPVAYFGDLSRAAYFGDRRGITFQTTDVGGNAWENDEIAYKATERCDINVANIGNNSATAAERVAGPLVAFVAT